METEKLMNEFKDLPIHAQKQVIDFILFLRRRYKHPVTERQSERIPLADEPFTGLWKERQEMSDSISWVRTIRNREWRLSK